MAVHTLNQSFIQIHYRSIYGKHVQTIQTRPWSLGGFSHGFGGYTTWNNTPIDADDMVNDFVDLVKVFADINVSWDEAIVWNYPSPPPTPPQPVSLFPLTQVGTATTTLASKALQLTMNYFDTGFNLFKNVFLDIDASGSFNPENYAGLSASKKALVDYILSDNHAWASRADLKPAVFRQAVWKYNDKLRKEYHQD